MGGKLVSYVRRLARHDETRLLLLMARGDKSREDCSYVFSLDEIFWLSEFLGHVT